MNLDLREFETIFHIAIIFNFVYTLENFGLRIKLFIPSSTGIIGDVLANISTAYLILKNSPPENLKRHAPKLLDSISRNFTKLSNLLNKQKAVEANADFADKFKCTYLLAGLFSFFILLLIGYEKSLDQEKLHHSLFCSTALLVYFIA